MFLVGTEEGYIHLCSTAYSGQYLETYKDHYLAVYSVKWNHFHPKTFLSCSADWTIKMWLTDLKRPILSYDLGNPIGDIAWAPYSSTVFAAVSYEEDSYGGDASYGGSDSYGSTESYGGGGGKSGGSYVEDSYGGDASYGGGDSYKSTESYGSGGGGNGGDSYSYEDSYSGDASYGGETSYGGDASYPQDNYGA